MSSKKSSEESIVRRINRTFVGKYVWHILKMDVLICIIAAVVSLFIAEKSAMGEFDIKTQRNIELSLIHI